jgi:hypothetical protein
MAQAVQTVTRPVLRGVSWSPWTGAVRAFLDLNKCAVDFKEVEPFAKTRGRPAFQVPVLRCNQEPPVIGAITIMDHMSSADSALVAPFAADVMSKSQLQVVRWAFERLAPLLTLNLFLTIPQAKETLQHTARSGLWFSLAARLPSWRAITEFYHQFERSEGLCGGHANARPALFDELDGWLSRGVAERSVSNAVVFGMLHATKGKQVFRDVMCARPVLAEWHQSWSEHIGR